MMARGPKPTFDRAPIAEDYRNGMEIREIQKKYGISTTVIYAAVKLHGLQKRLERRTQTNANW